MFLKNHCGGCGCGNQSCAIARCSMEHRHVAYCFECSCYPCEKYQNMDEFDSFITHRHQKSDLEKAQRIGIDRYNLEQKEKTQILDHLLSNYNDGRRKTFFCVAVNLLELSELQEAIKQIEANTELSALSTKERSQYVVNVVQGIADQRGLCLKLNRKKNR